MATNQKRSPSKAKPEEIIAYPGKRPVKSSAAAKGGSKNPADPMTGGGKIKSAGKQSEPLLESERIGKSPTKRKASASLPRDGAVDAGSNFGNKEGMVKSSQRKEPRIATAMNSGSSRAKPNAQKASKADAPGTSAKVKPAGKTASAKMPGMKPGAEKPTKGSVGAGKAAGGLSTKSRGR